MAQWPGVPVPIPVSGLSVPGGIEVVVPEQIPSNASGRRVF